MTDDSMQGSGDEMGRIELGEHKTVIVKDDGYNDPDISLRNPEGLAVSVATVLAELRREHGDAVLMDVLDGLTFDENASTTSEPESYQRKTAFACHDCYRTWPGVKNQTPDADEDTCPECHEADG